MRLSGCLQHKIGTPPMSDARISESDLMPMGSSTLHSCRQFVLNTGDQREPTTRARQLFLFPSRSTYLTLKILPATTAFASFRSKPVLVSSDAPVDLQQLFTTTADDLCRPMAASSRSGPPTPRLAVACSSETLYALHVPGYRTPACHITAHHPMLTPS
jgi:hypothetical protein